MQKCAFARMCVRACVIHYSLRKMKRSVWPEAQRDMGERGSQKVEREKRTFSSNEGLCVKKRAGESFVV